MTPAQAEESAAAKNKTLSRAKNIVEDILSTDGLALAVALSASADYANALAGEDPEGRPIIYINPLWLGAALRRDELTAVAVLAHELGHVLDSKGQDLFGGEIYEYELAADRFAGCILAKKGWPLKRAARFLALTPEDGSRTHPPRRERFAAVSVGWADGKAAPAASCRRTLGRDMVCAGAPVECETIDGQQICRHVSEC